MKPVENLTMLTDLYQMTMMNGYFENGVHEDTLVFDLFFRKNPSNGGYTVISGIEQVIDYIESIQFTPSDLAYLRALDLFEEAFIEYLADFRFRGEIYAVQEGRIMFPNEPIMRIKANALEAQFIETTLLCILNFQSLIATKASRVCHAAKGDPVMEFGLRRAQGPDAGLYGARAAVIGGCVGTSNVLAGKRFEVPILGTHAHSWVQKFPSELEAFRAYAKAYPDKTLLLIDTYDTLQSGIVNAITVFQELRAQGYEPQGVRIDSGDLEYLSKEVRRRLDEAGFPDAKITASNDLDESIIAALKSQGARIDIWGVGTRLITSADWSSLGGVYKLSASQEDGRLAPKIKISDDPAKVNNPGYKKVVRIYDKATDMAQADLILLEEETIDDTQPLRIFDPVYTWKSMEFDGNYYTEELLEPLFINGKLARPRVDVRAARAFCDREKERLWPQYVRNVNPQNFKVDLSEKLWNLKQDLLKEKKATIAAMQKKADSISK